MEIDSKPQALDTVERQIMQLEIEREALRKERDQASRERLSAIDNEIGNLRENLNALTARWQQEKAGHRGHPRDQEQDRRGEGAA